MTTKNARSRAQFVRSTSHTPDTGLKAHHVRNVPMHCQSVLATGRHHFSCWLGTRELAGVFELTDYGYLTKVTPGPNATHLQLSFLVQQVSATASLQVVDDTDATKTIPAGVESATTLSNLEEIVFTFAVTGGVETDIYFLTNGDYLVKGLTVSDLPLNHLETGDTGYIDMSSHYRGHELTVTLVQSTVTCQETILSDLRKVHVNLAPFIDDEPLESITPETTWANFFSSTHTVYDADLAPGFWIRPGAAYLADAAMQLRCRVKGASAGDSGIIKFVASGSAESAEMAFSSTADWYSATLDIVTPYNFQPQYSEKIELWAKDVSSTVMDIYNVIIEESDGT